MINAHDGGSAHPDGARAPEATVTRDFARRLKALREAYGNGQINAGKFAEALGVHPEKYRRYERGDSEPTLTTLRAIRVLTGASLCVLIAGLPHGDDTLIPGGIYEPTRGDRIRWTRQALLPDAKGGLVEAAHLLGMSVEEWRRVETDEAEPPFAVLIDFAHRFSVSTDFLLMGSLSGVHPKLLAVFRHIHPELLAAHERLERAQMASGTDPDNGRPGRLLLPDTP